MSIARFVRRFLRLFGVSIAAGITCVCVGFGLTDKAIAQPSLQAEMVLAAVLLIVLGSLIRRLRFTLPTARHMRASRWVAARPIVADIEVAIALVAGCYAVLAVTSQYNLHPLVYGVVAFGASFQGRAANVAMLAAVASLEWALWQRGGQTFDQLWTHLAFVAAAFCAHGLLMRGVMIRHRREHSRKIDEAMQSHRKSALEYRLIASSLGAESRAGRSREEEEQRLAESAVETIAGTIYFSLSLLRNALNAQSCVLLWRSDSNSKLRLKEVVSESEYLLEGPDVPCQGVVGAVVRDGSILMLPKTRSGQIPYYEGCPSTPAFVGVPVMDGQQLRGILCVDRQQEFSRADAALIEQAAQRIVHAVRSERAFAAVERAKYEHERFYQASALLCRALTMEQVMETAFDAAQQIVDYEVGAVTLYDAERHRHRVCSMRFTPSSAPLLQAEALRGLEFRDNAGLVSMVVKNRHYLPAGGELRDSNSTVFTKDISFRNVQSLLVLPLLSADQAIGTFCLISRRPGAFVKDVREMLGVIASQVAISMQNALMYKRMETMATTDGLTGLTNHRTFQERFADLLERSGRHSHHAAILLCDVDHFKSVNDTHGHPVGDEVLRRVAKVLRNAVRKIDIPARYGGEEFAVVLEATDLEGAMAIAERIREDVGRMDIPSEQGNFSITMSVGVAAFPDDAKEQSTLIERADMALYHAKESGRNRVVCYQEFQRSRQKRAG